MDGPEIVLLCVYHWIIYGIRKTELMTKDGDKIPMCVVSGAKPAAHVLA